MKKIIVASNNPVKINAALLGFQKMFPEIEFQVEGIAVPSNVSDQPMTDTETFQGALNRVNHAIEKLPKANYWVGIEGGIEEKTNQEIEAFAWIVIKNKEGKMGKGKTGTFFLPSKITSLIKQGIELGTADDMVFGDTNSKQKKGIVGALTGNTIDRKEYYAHAVVLALICFKNKDIYF